MSLIQIKIVYNYYSSKRVTPIYMLEEELQNSSFEVFKTRIFKDVPHLAKAASLRWTIDEDGLEVDLSPSYFNIQMRGILGKEKSIKINVIEFESPVVTTSSPNEAITKYKRINNKQSNQNVRGRARRSLVLPEQNQSKLGYVFGGESDVDTDDENAEESETRILMPLERYAAKQKETVAKISLELETGTRELQKFDEKIRRASMQNEGVLSTCGNCHLKLGHTKKICTFSPCKSAFSCGILSKHANEKAQRTAIEKDITRARVKLSKAQKEVNDASQAADKLTHSVSKRIEDIIIAERPDRYVSFGLRNWALLNKDVATLQKHLKGKLPSRENVQRLLDEFVNTKTSVTSKSKQVSSCTSNRPSAFSETDHRMSSHKHLLAENYAIKFPSPKKAQPVRSSSVCIGEELDDFKLALRLQQEEMSPPKCSLALTQNLRNNQVVVDDENPNPEPFQEPFESIDAADREKRKGNDIKFEADAAAALLQLKRRRESHS